MTDCAEKVADKNSPEKDHKSISSEKNLPVRKAARNEAKAFRCVRWDFHSDYLSAPVFVYRDRR